MADVEASVAALHKMFAEEHLYATQAIKFQEDFDRYSAVLERVRPDIIVEIGTWRGYSALWFARNAPPGCVVVTVDITNNVIDAEVLREMQERKIVRLGGKSTSPDNVRIIEALTRNRKTMFSLDGDHSAETVYAEMLHFAPMVSPGSYMVVEDGMLRYIWKEIQNKYQGSPLDAIEKFLQYDKRFVVDQEIEDMSPVTQNPSGWLRRV